MLVTAGVFAGVQNPTTVHNMITNGISIHHNYFKVPPPSAHCLGRALDFIARLSRLALVGKESGHGSM